jgi:hypothetical protein
MNDKGGGENIFKESEKLALIRAHLINTVEYVEGDDPLTTELSFPTTKDAVYAALKKIRTCKDNIENLNVRVFETELSELTTLFGDIDDATIDELNYLATKLNGMDDQESRVFLDLIELGEIQPCIVEIINAAENVGCYSFNAPDGSLRKEKETTVFYEGKDDIPAEYRVLDLPGYESIIEAEIYNNSIYEDEGYISAWVTFPTTKDALKEAFDNILLEGRKYTGYGINKSATDIIGSDDYLDESADINEVNYLAVKLSQLSRNEENVLKAVVDGSKYLNTAELINTVENIKCYSLLPSVTPAIYGESLLKSTLDEITMTAIDKFGRNDGEALTVLNSHLDQLKKYVDTERFGKDNAEFEGGKFTEYGYLTQIAETKEIYKGLEDIPNEYKVYDNPVDNRPTGIYKIENTDLTDFVYKFHVYAGDYFKQALYTTFPLVKEENADYILLMGDSDIKITAAEKAYQDYYAINNEFPLSSSVEKAFLLHVDNRENGRAYGSIVMVDTAVLSESVKMNSIKYTGVLVELHDGGSLELTRSQWESTEINEPSGIKDRKLVFTPDELKNLTNHRKEFFNSSLESATAITPGDLLDIFNSEYMKQAKYPRNNMMRVSPESARTMLLNSDMTIYRLMRDEPKQLSIITAAKDGGMLSHKICDYGVKRVDVAGSGIDRLCARELGKLYDSSIDPTNDKKRNKNHAEH